MMSNDESVGEWTHGSL